VVVVVMAMALFNDEKDEAHNDYDDVLLVIIVFWPKVEKI
jgi:hypothetical protein